MIPSVEDRIGPMLVPFLGPPGAPRLNIGCGRQVWRDWVNIDQHPSRYVDACVNLEDGVLPYPDGTFHTILACHVLEHVRNLVPLMRECHRVLVEGGTLIAITPYMGSDEAWEDPTHVRAFNEKSWRFFDRHIYEGEGNAGCWDSGVDFTFTLDFIHLVPHGEWVAKSRDSNDALAYERRTYRNVILEMRVALRKVAV